MQRARFEPGAAGWKENKPNFPFAAGSHGQPECQAGRCFLPRPEDHVHGRHRQTLLARSLRLPVAEIQLQLSRSDDPGVALASPDRSDRHGPQLRAHPVDVLDLRRKFAGAHPGSDGPGHRLVPAPQDRLPRGPEEHRAGRRHLRGPQLSRTKFRRRHFKQRRRPWCSNRISAHRLGGRRGRKRRRGFGSQRRSDPAVAVEAVQQPSGLEGRVSGVVVQRECQRRESFAQRSVLRDLGPRNKNKFVPKKRISVSWQRKTVKPSGTLVH